MSRGWIGRFAAAAAFLVFLCAMPGAPAAMVKKQTDGVPRPAVQSPADETASFREGEVLVKFRTRKTRVEAEIVANGLGAGIVREYPVLSRSRRSSYFLVASGQSDTARLLEGLGAHPDVEAVSPNYGRRLLSTPNDPKLALQWGLGMIGAANAWDKTIGSPGVVLAVMDTGVDYRHEDLAANIWHNPGEIAGNGTDDDHNGFVDDVYGFDFAASNDGGQDGDPMDMDTHGSHVAGTVSAAGNNGVGGCGVSWNSRLMVLKAFRPDRVIYDADSIAAFEYALLMKRDYGVNLVAINASFGGSGHNPLQEDAIAAVGDQGIIVVCAAGNDGADNDQSPFYPASYDLPNVIAVAASDNQDRLADFSNYGLKSVDIAAPGAGILSTVPSGRGLEASLSSGASIYQVILMEFAGSTPLEGLNRQLVDCGKGLDSSHFPAAVNGQIALIERGDSTFKEKTVLAQNAGAVAAVIYNNESGNFSGTLGEAGSWIPVVSMAREDGLLEKAKGMHPVTLVVGPSNYDYKDGTSMAAPHVCGALGLLAAHFPGDSMIKRIARVYAGADRLDSLAGKVKTSSRLNLDRSLSQELLLTLAVFRRQVEVWVLKKDYAQIDFSVDSDPRRVIVGARYGIYRSRAGGGFELIKEVAATELQNNEYTYYDKYLDNQVSYSYQVQVRNALGEVVSVSNVESI